MDEIRRNHIVKLVLKSEEYVEGEVIDYSNDRVMILIFPHSIESAKKINELDEVRAIAHTHMGIKEMISNVITSLDSLNCITIENNPSVHVVQKREFVRVVSDFKFKLSKEDKFYDCNCINISAGGVAFTLEQSDLNIGDEVTIALDKELFEKDIYSKAKIIKRDKNWHVAQFIGMKSHDEDKIVKYVFKTIVKK